MGRGFWVLMAMAMAIMRIVFRLFEKKRVENAEMSSSAREVVSSGGMVLHHRVHRCRGLWPGAFAMDISEDGHCFVGRCSSSLQSLLYHKMGT